MKVSELQETDTELFLLFIKFRLQKRKEVTSAHVSCIISDVAPCDKTCKYKIDRFMY
jgi:hypothetical protein